MQRKIINANPIQIPPVVVGNNNDDKLIPALRQFVGFYIDVAIYDAYHKARVASLKGITVNRVVNSED